MLDITKIINNVVTTLLVRHLYNCFPTFNILSGITRTAGNSGHQKCSPLSDHYSIT